MRRLRVDDERWRRAQEAELALWQAWSAGSGWRRRVWPLVRPLLAAVGSDRGTGDDWNRWWAEQFDGYSFLGNELGEIIELGCGPFTNVRHILRGRTASRVVCSDPLARHYVQFRGRWLADAHRKGRVVVDDHPLEELPFLPESFDVVVIINVLDHVRDAPLALRNAVGLVRPGGILVFGQDLVPPSVAETSPDDDVYHPIRLAQTDVEPALAEFQPIFRKDLPPSASRAPDTHAGTLIFAGSKLPRPADPRSPEAHDSPSRLSARRPDLGP